MHEEAEEKIEGLHGERNLPTMLSYIGSDNHSKDILDSFFFIFIDVSFVNVSVC